MTSIEGAISIDVKNAGGMRRDIKISSSRPVHASRIFVGKTPQQALSTIPLLFNICGVAQARTALAAIQNADSIHSSRNDDTARSILVLVENAKEHLMRILLDWPTLFKVEQKPKNLPYVSQLINQFKSALYEKGDAFSLDSQCNVNIKKVNTLTQELETYLSTHVFAMPIEQWLAIHDIDSLYKWAQTKEDVAAQTLHIICDQGWATQGTTQCEFLPPLDNQLLQKKFMSESANEFIAQPQWQNNCYETSCFTRQSKHPLFQALHHEFYSGLLTRWVARLIELAGIPEQIKKLSRQFTKTPHNSNQKASGIAQTEAARGRLIHHVSIEKGIIKQYQILAPTEWNFHANGLVHESLSHISAKNDDQWQQLAHLVINAIDPCVGYQLRMH